MVSHHGGSDSASNSDYHDDDAEDFKETVRLGGKGKKEGSVTDHHHQGKEVNKRRAERSNAEQKKKHLPKLGAVVGGSGDINLQPSIIVATGGEKVTDNNEPKKVKKTNAAALTIPRGEPSSSKPSTTSFAGSDDLKKHYKAKLKNLPVKNVSKKTNSTKSKPHHHHSLSPTTVKKCDKQEQDEEGNKLFKKNVVASEESAGKGVEDKDGKKTNALEMKKRNEKIVGPDVKIQTKTTDEQDTTTVKKKRILEPKGGDKDLEKNMLQKKKKIKLMSEAPSSSFSDSSAAQDLTKRDAETDNTEVNKQQQRKCEIEQSSVELSVVPFVRAVLRLFSSGIIPLPSTTTINLTPPVLLPSKTPTTKSIAVSDNISDLVNLKTSTAAAASTVPIKQPKKSLGMTASLHRGRKSAKVNKSTCLGPSSKSSIDVIREESRPISPQPPLTSTSLIVNLRNEDVEKEDDEEMSFSSSVDELDLEEPHQNDKSKTIVPMPSTSGTNQKEMSERQRQHLSSSNNPQLPQSSSAQPTANLSSQLSTSSSTASLYDRFDYIGTREEIDDLLHLGKHYFTHKAMEKIILEASGKVNSNMRWAKDSIEVMHRSSEKYMLIFLDAVHKKAKDSSTIYPEHFSAVMRDRRLTNIQQEQQQQMEETLSSSPTSSQSSFSSKVKLQISGEKRENEKKFQDEEGKNVLVDKDDYDDNDSEDDREDDEEGDNDSCKSEEKEDEDDQKEYSDDDGESIEDEVDDTSEEECEIESGDKDNEDFADDDSVETKGKEKSSSSGENTSNEDSIFQDSQG